MNKPTTTTGIRQREQARINKNFLFNQKNGDKHQAYSAQSASDFDKQVEDSLDILNQKTEMLRTLTVKIDEEVGVQNILAGNMIKDFDKTESILKVTMNRLTDVVKNSGSSHLCLLVLFIVLLFVVFYYMISYSFRKAIN